jgi:glycosyltransferase involved in cell wall biosynthesis
VSDLKTDVLISYTIKPVVWGTLAAAQASVPQRVAMITGLGYAFTDAQGVKRALVRSVAKILYRFALRRSTRIIFQNPDDRALFKQLGLLPDGNRTAIVNGSGVDTAAFPDIALPDSTSFLMIARLLGDKGVREYGDAARMVKQSYPDVPVRLVGFLDESPDCITQDELDRMIEGGVEFVGKLDDVRPAIANARIYVLPSYREGTPRSVLEAMSMGRAIITTDAPGLP